MPKILMNLRNVPEDEADAVLNMLNENQIEHYQVPPSAFMISAGSIWVQHDADYPKAKALFDQLQQERAEQAQADWQTQKDQGIQPGLFDALQQHPGRFIAYLAIAVLIVMFMLTPVIQLFR